MLHCFSFLPRRVGALLLTTPLLLSALLVQPNGAANAQTRFSVAEGSEFRVDGRSTDNDWTVSTTNFSGWMELSDEQDALSVSALELTVPSAEIKGSRGLIMNRVMSGSLKTEEYPEITFGLTGVEHVETDSTNLRVTGNLTLTGTTKEIEFDLLAHGEEDGELKYSGSLPLTMTEYGMEPPTVMFGRLRVHRDVTISFDLAFTPASGDQP